MIPPKLQSKKFLAFFFSQILIGVLIAYGMIRPAEDIYAVVFRVAGMLGICSLAIGYVISQKALDKFLAGIEGIADATNDRKTME